MTTNKQIRTRTRWGVLGLLTMAALLVAAAAASGAELVTAEVDATPNDVTVTQGTTTNFNIKLLAIGNISSLITRSNASTAAVKTEYSLTSGSLTSSNFSGAMKFYSSGTGCNGGNCNVTWDSPPAPAPYSVPASVAADLTTPVGAYTITLSPGAGTIQIANSSVSGGKLGDDLATTVTVHVVAPVVTNHPPTVATPAADATGNEGADLSTNGAFQDQDGNSLTITKASGAGTVTDNGDGTWSWSYTPTDDGSGTVAVEANDGHGGSVTDTFTWSAANVAPTAAITSPPSSSPEGTPISLASTVTDPSSADTAAGFTKSWTVTKDGNAYDEGSGSSFSFTPDDNGTYLVSLSATDKDNGTGHDSTTITVSNVAPTVGALTLGGSSGTACIGGNTVTLDFGFSDPGASDNPWAVDINWGDGNHTTYSASSQGAQPQRSHSFPAGSYTISVSVTDKDNGTGSKPSATNAVSHTYNLSSILQPINSDGSSVFKSGSTIPVKVQILDCNSQPVPGLSPQIGTQLKSSSNPDLAIDEVSSTSAADSGTTMRYDSTAGQYIYNLASKSLSDQSATYYVYVRESHSVGKTPTGGASPGQSYQQFGLKLK